jgi:hypothetical protein
MLAATCEESDVNSKPNADAEPGLSVVQVCALENIARRVHTNIRGLTIEKFGVCPAVAFGGEQKGVTAMGGEELKGGLVLGVPHLLEYVLVEMLKNSVRSVSCSVFVKM